MNPNSHHWSGAGGGRHARDRASRLGGSMFGSGSREEEEAMLPSVEEEGELEDGLGDDLGDSSGGANPWGRERGVSGGVTVDPAGAIRL